MCYEVRVKNWSDEENYRVYRRFTFVNQSILSSVIEEHLRKIYFGI